MSTCHHRWSQTISVLFEIDFMTLKPYKSSYTRLHVSEYLWSSFEVRTWKPGERVHGQDLLGLTNTDWRVCTESCWSFEFCRKVASRSRKKSWFGVEMLEEKCWKCRSALRLQRDFSTQMHAQTQTQTYLSSYLCGGFHSCETLPRLLP